MIKIIIAAALLGGAAPTLAAPVQTSTDQAPTVRVRSIDLDLSRPEQMKVLRHRIAVAISTVCGWPADGGMDAVMANSRCRLLAVRSSDKQIAALTDRSTMVAQANTPTAAGVPVIVGATAAAVQK